MDIIATMSYMAVPLIQRLSNPVLYYCGMRASIFYLQSLLKRLYCIIPLTGYVALITKIAQMQPY